MLLQLIVAVIVGIIAGTITGFHAHNTSIKKLISKNNDKCITQNKSKIIKTTPIRIKSKNKVDRIK